jgi:hypothetical protein
VSSVEPVAGMARLHAMRRIVAAVSVCALFVVPGCGADDRSPSPPASAGNSSVEEMTTVPEIEFGTSVDKAKRILERAGLVGHSEDVDWPHYATGTNPPAGTTVHVGDTIEITIGDG